jgi:hypothetical protein
MMVPNGGSDNCATCCFNRRNKGDVGYAHANSEEPHYCLIRHFQIDDYDQGYWTYCGNHPHLPNGRMDIPIGPVFKNELGKPGPREVCKESPDSEEIRQNLLQLIAGITPVCTEEHYEPYFKGIVIFQLARFREERALADLQRIANFDKDSPDVSRRLVNAAGIAIERIRQTAKGRDQQPFWPSEDLGS